MQTLQMLKCKFLITDSSKTDLSYDFIDSYLDLWLTDSVINKTTNTKWRDICLSQACQQKKTLSNCGEEL